MEGNIVKAAWVLGGSIFVSTLIGGGGVIVSSVMLSRQISAETEAASKRATAAILEAPKNTRVVVAGASEQAIRVDLTTPNPFKVTAAVPEAMGLRVENGIEQGSGARVPFQVLYGK